MMKPNRLKVTEISIKKAIIHTGCRICSGTKKAAEQAPHMVVKVMSTVKEAPAVAAPVAAGNAMAPLLVLFAAIARGDGVALLPAGPGRVLRVELDHG